MPTKGEGIEIAARNLRGFNNRVLTLPDDVASVTLTVFTGDYATVLLGPVAMTYVEADNAYVYVWVTPTNLPSSMKRKIEVVSTDGVPSVKFGRLRMKTNPHP